MLTIKRTSIILLFVLFAVSRQQQSSNDTKLLDAVAAETNDTTTTNNGQFITVSLTSTTTTISEHEHEQHNDEASHDTEDIIDELESADGSAASNETTVEVIPQVGLNQTDVAVGSNETESTATTTLAMDASSQNATNVTVAPTAVSFSPRVTKLSVLVLFSSTLMSFLSWL